MGLILNDGDLFLDVVMIWLKVNFDVVMLWLVGVMIFDGGDVVVVVIEVL